MLCGNKTPFQHGPGSTETSRPRWNKPTTRTRQTWFRNRTKWHRRPMRTTTDKMWFPHAFIPSEDEQQAISTQKKNHVPAEERYLVSQLQPILAQLRDLAHYRKCHDEARLLPSEDRNDFLTHAAWRAYEQVLVSFTVLSGH